METGEHQGDERLFERLQEAAAEDAQLHQLRRRYDDLRQDYERLLSRLEVIEEQLTDTPEAESDPAPAPPPVTSLDQILSEPLLRLRDEYTAAAARIQGIIAGLERLASGAMKAQRSSAAPADAETKQPAATDEPRPRKLAMEVKGTGFGELLDFQEKLSAIPGVSRVSIVAIEEGRANLVVELHRDSD